MQKYKNSLLDLEKLSVCGKTCDTETIEPIKELVGAIFDDKNDVSYK